MTNDDRRALLLAAAMKLAETKGVAALSAREVAREAGVSLGVVHGCYPTKDELITDVAKAVTAEVREAVDLGGLMWDNTGTGIDALRSLAGRVLLVMWESMQSAPTRQLVAYEIATYAIRGGEGRINIAREQNVFNDEAVASVLELATRATHTRWTTDVAVLGRFYLNAIEGLRLRYLIDSDRDAVEAQLNYFAEMIATQAEDVEAAVD